MKSIRDRRVALGLGQRELATMADVDRATLVRVEAGEANVRPETVQRVVFALEQAEDIRFHRPPGPNDVTVEVLLPGGERLRFTGPPGGSAREAAEFLRVHAEFIEKEF